MSTKTGQGQVDTLTSNVGHLIGTGILSEEEEKAVAALLVDPAMSSGFGTRTLSTGARGHWPLSHRVGSVCPGDTAAPWWLRVVSSSVVSSTWADWVAEARRFGSPMPGGA